MANTHSHLTLSDRIYIEQALERRMKFKDIALFIEKDPTTVSKEIRRHRVAKESGRRLNKPFPLFRGIPEAYGAPVRHSAGWEAAPFAAQLDAQEAGTV